MPASFRQPPRVFYFLMWLLVLLVAVGVFLAARRTLVELAGRCFFRYAAEYLSPQYRDLLVRELAEQVSGIYDAIPEPDVGRILQKNVSKRHGGVEVACNNAGLRDRRRYGPKSPGVFRVVVLGDSYVFGSGGREEDRLGNQLEEQLALQADPAGGRRVEVYSLGVPSWSTLNEVRYLSARLSAYDPDLIVVFMVGNDFGSSLGVTGYGSITRAFSPEYRADGSGVFSVYASQAFGVMESNCLDYDLGPECRGRWRKAFAALKRLENLQSGRGKRMLLVVLKNREFLPLVFFHHRRQGLHSPLLVSDYLMEPKAVLPADPHPSRFGHRLLAAHILHFLAERDWLEVDESRLAPLHPALELTAAHPVEWKKIAAHRRRLAREHLPESIDFRRLRGRDLKAVLGGLIPAAPPPRALDSPPYGTLKTGVLLLPRPGASRVVVELEVPPLPELYPFRLDVHLQGRPAAVLELPNVVEAGKQVLRADIPDLEGEPALEVVLRTSSYWAGIADPRMKSYRLLEIRQE